MTGCRRPVRSRRTSGSPATRSRWRTSAWRPRASSTSRVGAGTFVTAGPRARAPRIGRDGVADATGTVDVRAVADQRRPAPPPAYDFRVGIPDAALFPFDTWRRLVTAELRAGAHSPGTYAEPAGHPGLRAAIARYVGLRAASPADADDVLVTNGTQQALDLVARVLVSPGDVVAVEDPGYPPARDLFASHGARVVAGAGRRATDWSSTGCPTMPGWSSRPRRTSSRSARRCRGDRRRALLEWADRRGVRDRRGRLRQRVPVLRPARSSRCTRSTSTAGCSTSARSPRRCCPRCGPASWWRRRRSATRCARRGSSPTATGSRPSRPRSRASSTRACSPATSAAPGGVRRATGRAARRARPAARRPPRRGAVGGRAARLRGLPRSGGRRRGSSRPPREAGVAVEALAVVRAR